MKLIKQFQTHFREIRCARLENFMNFRNKLHKVADKALLAVGLRPELDDLGTYTFTSSEVEKLRSKAASGVAAFLFANEGRPVHKWHHYLEVFMSDTFPATETGNSFS